MTTGMVKKSSAPAGVNKLPIEEFEDMSLVYLDTDEALMEPG